MSQAKKHIINTKKLNTARMQSIYNKGFTVLGDFWTLHIIYVLSRNSLRFNDLQRENKGISPSVLSNRLKKLEQLGLIKRAIESKGKLAISYSLSEKGEGMIPILHEMYNFAEKFLL